VLHQLIFALQERRQLRQDYRLGLAPQNVVDPFITAVGQVRTPVERADRCRKSLACLLFFTEAVLSHGKDKAAGGLHGPARVAAQQGRRLLQPVWPVFRQTLREQQPQRRPVVLRAALGHQRFRLGDLARTRRAPPRTGPELHSGEAMSELR
jgi:hypothetical protein